MENYLSVSLPSKCLVYPGVDAAAVKVRTLKGKDEKLIAELNYDNFERKFLALLRNVLQGVDAEKLTIGDRLYLVIWEAINSYSKMYAVDFVCTNCLEKIKDYEIDLSQLELVSLPDDFKEPYAVKLSNGDSVNLRLFRVEDEIKIADYEAGGKVGWVYRYALSIVDDKKGIWDRVEYLENLDVKDFALIRAFHEKFHHGPRMEHEYTCPQCGAKGVVDVPFRIEILFPYGKALRSRFANAI